MNLSSYVLNIYLCTLHALTSEGNLNVIYPPILYFSCSLFTHVIASLVSHIPSYSLRGRIIDQTFFYFLEKLLIARLASFLSFRRVGSANVNEYLSGSSLLSWGSGYAPS